MSGNNTTGAFQGFSVVQPSLGAALQWYPALGTQELDDLINAFLPGPSSIQDKRAQISMDFFEYSRLTGETLKFYPVLAATSSPASSAQAYDSGYVSNFNVSPIITESQWVDSPSTFTPISFDEASVRSPSSSSTSKRTAASSSRQHGNDFANHPGMRIMTKDGRDVTNSASRGCKTKEQRDHAHLMRIIKACDSCRRKKIRCDPSHKKKAASPATTATVEKKSSKKYKKKAAPAAEAPPPNTNEFSLDLLNDESFDFSQFTFPTFETTTDGLDELWNQYVQDSALYTNDFTNYVPGDFGLVTDQQLSHVSPSTGSSATSPSQVYTPYTPTPPGPSPPTVVCEAVPEVSQGDPTLPYLNPGIPHGTDYVDFNLFSPPADFLLDEQPQSVNKRPASGRQQRSAQPRSPVNSHITVDNIAPFEYVDALQTGGLAHSGSSPGSQQPFSPGLIGVSQFSTQAVEAIASPSAVFHDLGSPVLESAVLQRSRGPDQQYTDRPRVGLEGYEPFYDGGVTVSRPEQSGVNVQSTARASVRLGTSYNAAGGVVANAPSAVVASSFAPVSTTVVSSSTDSPQAFVNSPRAGPAGPAVESLPGDAQGSRRPATDAQVSVLQIAVPVNVGLGQRTNVTVSMTQQGGSSGSGQLVQSQSGVQELGPVPSIVDVGSTLNAVTATTLKTSPVRHLPAGVSAQPGHASVLSSLVYTQLVVLGLVSYLLLCLVGTQLLRSLVNTLVSLTTVSLTVLTAEHRSSSDITQPSALVAGNFKSRVQATGCKARQQASLFAPGISFSRLASAHSLAAAF